MSIDLFFLLSFVLCRGGSVESATRGLEGDKSLIGVNIVNPNPGVLRWKCV